MRLGDGRKKKRTFIFIFSKSIKSTNQEEVEGRAAGGRTRGCGEKKETEKEKDDKKEKR